jgi:excisionase family DNA binding protein
MVKEVTMPVMEKQLLTVEEVANKLQVSKDTVWRLIRQKELVAYRIAGSLRIHPDDLQKYLDKQKTDQTE